ncbi:MAG: type II toxin-antitoxin system YafQ family toxin [Caldilineaceae bacterium]
MFSIKPTPTFLEDVERLQAQGIDLEPLQYVIGLLAKEKRLNRQYVDHALRTRFAGMRECHIEDDWLLIYRVEKGILHLIATGPHKDLFD